MVLLAGAGESLAAAGVPLAGGVAFAGGVPSAGRVTLAGGVSLRRLSLIFAFGELSFPNTERFEFVTGPFSSGFGVFSGFSSL